MLDVLAEWADDLVWPFALGSVGVALTWLPTRNPRRWSTIVIGSVTLIFLVGVHDHGSDVIDALLDGPPWFAGVALLAGIASAAAMAHLLAEGRGPEGLLVLGVGVGAAAAALPDVEVLLGAAALWVPWLLAPRSPRASGPRRPAREGPRSTAERMGVIGAAVVVAGLVSVALVDGARGRPGSLLVAPVVVGPVVLTALLPAPGSRTALGARAVVTGIVGLVVARHAGLGAGTTRPLLGSVIGLLIILSALRGSSLRRPRDHRG